MSFWIDSHQPLEFFDLQWRAAPGISPKGFIPDPAAPIFLEKLGLPIKKFLSLDQQQQQHVMSSCWLDQQCLEFFQDYPEGLVIEIGAGYSSRFHRLSSVMEWPRFKWCVLDQQPIIDSLRNLLPAIDHFNLAVDSESVGWIKELPAASAIALVIEQKTLKLNNRDIEKLCSKLIVESGMDYCVNHHRFNPAVYSSRNILQLAVRFLFFTEFFQPEFVVLPSPSPSPKGRGD